jgi:hypothetical protein
VASTRSDAVRTVHLSSTVKVRGQKTPQRTTPSSSGFGFECMYVARPSGHTKGVFSFSLTGFRGHRGSVSTLKATAAQHRGSAGVVPQLAGTLKSQVAPSRTAERFREGPSASTIVGVQDEWVSCVLTRRRGGGTWACQNPRRVGESPGNITRCCTTIPIFWGTAGGHSRLIDHTNARGVAK